MGRTLTISRVSVLPGCTEEYVRTVHALAALGAGRGQRLWLFQNPAEPLSFVEFSESSSALNHRARASRTGAELDLEQTLRRIARYAPDAWTVWEEVPVPGTPAS
jgi:sarcosine oxidase gamma subunit